MTNRTVLGQVHEARDLMRGERLPRRCFDVQHARLAVSREPVRRQARFSGQTGLDHQLGQAPRMQPAGPVRLEEVLARPGVNTLTVEDTVQAYATMVDT